MLNPEQLEYQIAQIKRVLRTATVNCDHVFSEIQATFDGLAKELSDMMYNYDSARDSLRDCGSEECDAYGPIESRLEDPVLQEWVDRTRKKQTIIKIQFKDGGENQLVSISYDEAKKLADSLVDCTEHTSSQTLTVEALPKDDV